MQLPTIALFRSCFGTLRLAEFSSVTQCFYPDRNISWLWDSTCFAYHGGDYGPSVVQPLPTSLAPEQFARIAHACVTCKGVYQVLGEGTTFQECIDSVERWSDGQILATIEGTWSMQIEFLGRNRRLHPTERRERIEAFRHVLGVLSQRTVDVENPDHELLLLEDCRKLEGEHDPNSTLPTQYYWLLLRVPTTKDDSAESATAMVQRSDVRKRAFIDTTTMSADRALLMCNLGLVTKHSRLLDPFCGSGGLLVAGALLGARCVGGDIDASLAIQQSKTIAFPKSPHRPLRGVEDVSIMDSFRELGLAEPSIFAGMDIQSSDTIEQYQTQHTPYDAIVTDPPYGIRETMSSMDNRAITERLCAVGAILLKPSGRLVYVSVFASTKDDSNSVQKMLCQELHPQISPYGFQLVHVAVERFTMRLWRATIVLELQ